MIKCPNCDSKVSIKKSKTVKNPNREFYSCSNPNRCWIGWVDETKLNNGYANKQDARNSTNKNQSNTTSTDQICPELKCQKPITIRISKSLKNPNRNYYHCVDHRWQGWVDEGPPKIFTRENNLEVQFPDSFLPQNYEPLPRIIKAININSTSRSGLFNKRATAKHFQSMSCSPKIVETGKLSEKYVDFIRPMAQWRLDYFKNETVKIDKELKLLIFQALNILNRGTLTFSTPRVRELMDKNYGDKISENELHNVSKLILNKPTNPFKLSKSNSIFGSSLESDFWSRVEKFKEEHNSSLNLIPQLSLNSITNGMNDSDTRVVDFFGWNPLSSMTPSIFEIDGIQHQTQNVSDQTRDNTAELKDIPTHRITSENLKQNENIFDFLDISKVIVDDNEFDSNSNTNQQECNLRLSKFIHQIQICILYGILSGKLKPNETKLISGVYIPKIIKEKVKEEMIIDLISKSLLDVHDLLSNLSGIYGFNTNIPSFDFKIINKKSNQQNDLNIVDPQYSNEPNKDFIISDVSTPFNIGFNETFHGTLKITNPSKKCGKWLLKYLFGHDYFQKGQWESIKNVFIGKDSILLLKTSGGKSLVYQFVGIIKPGISIIISPLVSLIDDQITNLKANGFDNVIGITGKTPSEDRLDLKTKIPDSFFKYIYVSPERLQIDSFRETISSTLLIQPISTIAIDEAHCVSEWGHDFRTSYLNIANISREMFKFKDTAPTLIGMTGTASKPVLNDLIRELKIEEVISTGDFNREEIGYKIITCHSNEKEAKLKQILNELPNDFSGTNEQFFRANAENSNCGIIFAPHVNGQFGIMFVKNAVEMTLSNEPLIFAGSSPKGVSDIDWEIIKSESTQKFRRNDNTIMIATKAYGMGIDKKNIRFTIHYNLPPSIESFYQESGRAGRDGNKSMGYLIISNDNPEISRKLLDINTSSREIRAIIDNQEPGDKDDISRNMFFHTNSFSGADEDLEEVGEIFNIIKSQVEDLYKPQNLQISWAMGYDPNNNSQNYKHFDSAHKLRKEKAIHRLSILGIIEDYTVNFSQKTFNISLSAISTKQIINNLIDYVTAFRKNRSLNAQIESLRNNIEKYDYDDFIFRCSEQLINFIYDTIEKSRRTAQSNVLQSQTDSSEMFRRRVLSYLNTENPNQELELDEIEDFDSNATVMILDMLKNISPNEAFDLRGSVSRRLEDNPEDFNLRLLRFGTELLCGDTSEDSAIENARASVKFSSEARINTNETIDAIIQIFSYAIKTNNNIDFEKIIAGFVFSQDFNQQTQLDLIKSISDTGIINNETLSMLGYNIISDSIISKTKSFTKILN